jgi:hypothetical protein
MVEEVGGWLPIFILLLLGERGLK